MIHANRRIALRLPGLLLLLLVLMSFFTPALAAGFTLQVHTDLPAAWAQSDVFMAQYAYDLGSAQSYTGFQSELTSAKFAPVLSSLAEAAKIFGVAGSFPKTLPDQGFLTRGVVITALYETVLNVKNADQDDAAAWFIINGLMSGRASGEYALDTPCTVEEMLVLAVRSYEYLAYSANEDSKGFFWAVQGEGNTVYLLGSIHITDGSIYPLSRAITDAYARSEYLVVEADIFGMTAYDQMALMQKGTFPEDSGETIKDHVSPEIYELYASVMSSFGFEPSAYDNMKPWLATMILQSLSEIYSEEEAYLGLDMYFLRRAYSTGLDIIELEGAAFQFDVFDSFSPELAEYQLLGTLLGVISDDSADDVDPVANGSQGAANSQRQAYLDLLEIVKAGDEVALSALLTLDFAFENPLEIEYRKVFLVDRNLGMAEKIFAFLSDDALNGDYFVVVGAAHMFGEEGIVALLSDQGYRVERR